MVKELLLTIYPALSLLLGSNGGTDVVILAILSRAEPGIGLWWTLSPISEQIDIEVCQAIHPRTTSLQI